MVLVLVGVLDNVGVTEFVTDAILVGVRVRVTVPVVVIVEVSVGVSVLVEVPLTDVESVGVTV